MEKSPVSEESELRTFLARLRRQTEDEERYAQALVARANRFREELAARGLEAQRMGNRLNFRKALGMRSGLAGPESAVRIWERNKRLYRGDEIASAILDACDMHPEALTALRGELAEHGALVERQGAEVFAARLADPRWVIGEATGMLPEMGPWQEGGADCQVFVPEDRADAEWAVPLLRPGADTIYDEDLYREIMQAGPASSALIDQIAVDREFAHCGMAAEARFKAFTAVRDLEREHPIDHLIGLAFCIQGLELSGGRRFLLNDHAEKSISNMISLFINEQSRRCPATVVGRFRGRKTPVDFTCQGEKLSGSLLIDWYWLDHRTEHIR